MKIVFATNNKNKLTEIRKILEPQLEIVSLSDIGCEADIPETADTLEGNALLKARYIADQYHLACFADDTGLEVEALNGAPGVHSARFDDTTDHDSEANMRKLLHELDGKDYRRARFRTVIAFIPASHDTDSDSSPLFFEGMINGLIAREKHGTGGFGYDPIFIPNGYDKTFAELGTDIKNRISHRALAVRKLADHLLHHFH